MPIKHTKVSAVPDNAGAPGLVQPSEWNADHDAATLNVGTAQATLTAPPLVVSTETVSPAFAVIRASDAGGAQMALYKARGTLAAPTAVQAFDGASLSFYMWDGAAWRNNAVVNAYTLSNATSDNVGGYLRFYTRPAGAAGALTERWAMQDTGAWVPLLPYDIGTAALPTGNVYANALAFPATQVPSAGTNVLDDYEEGTWTPSLSFATPGNLAITYGNRLGTYVKVGGQVTCSYYVTTTAFTHTTASGNALISGLPFTSLTGTMQYGSAMLVASGWTSAGTSGPMLIVRPNATIGDLYGSVSGGSAGGFTTATLATGTQKDLRGTLTYFTT